MKRTIYWTGTGTESWDDFQVRIAAQGDIPKILTPRDTIFLKYGPHSESKWEHIVEHNLDADQLEEMGLCGWELTAATYYAGIYASTTFYFKRELPHAQPE